MGRYKLLALDMDGTLLDSHKCIPPRTAQTIEGLVESGTDVCLSTGRSATELADYLPELPFVRYGSLISGALAYDFAQRRPLAVHALPTDVALDLIRTAKLEDAMVHLLCLGGSVALERDIARMPQVHMGIYQDLFERLFEKPESVEDYVTTHDGEVMKVNLYHLDAAARERTRRRVEGMPLELADAEETSLECSPAGTSKATGLSELCRALGISLDEVVAVGDAPNDLAAIEAVGCGVAMGNATDEVRAAADLVVADNDHGGVIEAIERLF